MAAIAMTKDLKLMMARLTPFQTTPSNTLLAITGQSNLYTGIQFFMNVQPKDQRQRSIPLHSLINYDLADLENLHWPASSAHATHD